MHSEWDRSKISIGFSIYRHLNENDISGIEAFPKIFSPHRMIDSLITPAEFFLFNCEVALEPASASFGVRDDYISFNMFKSSE